jgi:hypothetical protein
MSCLVNWRRRVRTSESESTVNGILVVDVVISDKSWFSCATAVTFVVDGRDVWVMMSGDRYSSSLPR